MVKRTYYILRSNEPNIEAPYLGVCGWSEDWMEACPWTSRGAAERFQDKYYKHADLRIETFELEIDQ